MHHTLEFYDSSEKTRDESLLHFFFLFDRKNDFLITLWCVHTVTKIIISLQNISKTFNFHFSIRLYFATMCCTMHTVTNSKFLSKKSISMDSSPTLNLIFCAKNGNFQRLIFLTKLYFATVCVVHTSYR